MEANSLVIVWILSGSIALTDPNIAILVNVAICVWGKNFKLLIHLQVSFIFFFLHEEFKRKELKVIYQK